MKRKGLFVFFRIAIMLALVIGIANAAQAMTMSCSYEGEQVVWELRTNPGISFINNSFMEMDNGLDPACDPGMSNVHLTSEDIASTTGIFADENGDGYLDLITVTANNPYPGYYNEISTKVYNCGTEPVLMPELTLTWLGQNIQVGTGTVVTLCDETGAPAIEFCWLDNTGREIAPGVKLEDAFEFHIISGPTPPEPPGIDGLTPGYWKNWDNHYSDGQFSQLLQGTIADSIYSADAIFSKYSSAPGKELTILKAHLLAVQLTLNLTKMPSMPNPDGAFLSEYNKIEYNGVTYTVKDVVQSALDILANPSSYTRGQILELKSLLDTINNLQTL